MHPIKRLVRAGWTLTLSATFVGAPALGAQRVADARSAVVALDSDRAFGAEHRALAAEVPADDMSGRRCPTLCTTAIGAVAGAAVGAGATAIYVYHKPPANRDLADGPAIALGAILGAVVGGAIGLAIGLSR